MGRKAVTKSRKAESSKKQEWGKALFPFFQQHGVKGVTIDDMANWLGKSKSTLYEYFVSKHEIVEFAIRSKIGDVSGYREILEDESTPFRQRYIDFLQLITTEMSGVTVLFFSELKAYFPEQWKIIARFLQEIIDSLSQYYTQGIQKGAFHRIHVALLVAQDRHFIFELMTNPQFLTDNNLKISELIEQYLKLKLDGLAT